MNGSRVVEVRPETGPAVESSASMALKEAVMRAARVISGEAGVDALGFEVGKPLKEHTNEIAGALQAMVAPLQRAIDALGFDAAGQLSTPAAEDATAASLDDDLKGPAGDRRSSGTSPLAELEDVITEAVPASAILPPVLVAAARCTTGAVGPYRCVLADGHDGPHESADGPSWIDGESVPPVLLGAGGVRVLSIADAEYTRDQLARIEHARAVLGGTPLDLAARLLHDVERRAGRPVVDGDRIALATHLEGTAAALLAGASRHIPGHDHEGVRNDLARAERTIGRLREEIAETRIRERNAREREAERTRERDEWQRLAEQGQTKIEDVRGELVRINARADDAQHAADRALFHR